MTDRGTILAVDDIHESLELVTAILTARGYHVRPVASGELAIASVETSLPDLILLDIFMPGMKGFEVLRWLKAREASRNIPVIILSSSMETEQRVEGLKLGAVDHISKPFQSAELLARVRTHMELRRLSIELEQHADELKMANARLQVEIVERKKAEEAERQKSKELQKAIDRIKILNGLLPICSHCRKIRDEKGAWSQLEAYIVEHADTEFTHGICEDCLNKQYPEQAKQMRKDRSKKG